jgi:hypothetical protein
VRFLAEHGPDVYQEVRRCRSVAAPLLSTHSMFARVLVLNVCTSGGSGCSQRVPDCMQKKLTLVVSELACPVTM